MESESEFTIKKKILAISLMDGSLQNTALFLHQKIHLFIYSKQRLLIASILPSVLGAAEDTRYTSDFEDPRSREKGSLTW